MLLGIWAMASLCPLSLLHWWCSWSEGMFLSDLLSQMSVIFGKPGEVPCRSWKELLEGNCRTHSSRGANNGEKGEEG